MKYGKFTMNDIADALDVSVQTIRRWVQFAEEFEAVGGTLPARIPNYEVRQGIRLWSPSIDTIEEFKGFREHLPKGVMAEWNAMHSWGTRGLEILERKANT